MFFFANRSHVETLEKRKITTQNAAPGNWVVKVHRGTHLKTVLFMQKIPRCSSPRFNLLEMFL